MRCLVLLIALALTPLAAAAAPVGDAVAFYAEAQAWTQAPHAVSELRLACARKAGDGYVSLLADGAQRIVMAAFGAREPRDAQALFGRGPEATRDWAWLWDRNHDGAVDYLAFFLGTELVVPELPAGFPRGNSPRLDAAQLDFVLHNMRRTFYHAADDNFDGAADAAVYPLRDAETWIWVRGAFFLRSTHFDGKVDDDWAFAERPQLRLGPAPRNEHGYRVRIDPAEGERGEAVLADWTDWFARINAAVRDCALGRTLR